jgi:adenosylmethionine-8-amino-7-oxononanoate aminotransferase
MRSTTIIRATDSDYDDRRLEHVTKQLESIQRAQSYHGEAQATPSLGQRASPQHAAPTMLLGEAVGESEFVTTKMFHLDEVDEDHSQVEPQELKGVRLERHVLFELFRQ